MKKIDYKYSEDRLIKELQEYVDATYGEHYSQNKFQTTEFIILSLHQPLETKTARLVKNHQDHSHHRVSLAFQPEIESLHRTAPRSQELSLDKY